MRVNPPYLLFLGDAQDALAAKTAIGVRQWRPESCVGQLRLPGCRADAGLPDLSVEAAAAAGARTLVLGVANRGGVVSEAWIAPLVRALELGLDVASGLHRRLADVAALREAAARSGAALHDVRHPTETFEVARGVRRPGKRLLTVGTDCSVGKMYTTLAIDAEMRRRGRNATFRATGQTGILIAGGGVAVDAVVADFISGAVEWLAPANDPGHWDLIEGQGSLFHPSFAGVSLGLLHGAQPDALVMCHEPRRPHMRGVPGFRLPALAACIDANLEAARLVNRRVRCVGVSLNTAALSARVAAGELRRTEDRLGLPCVDPARTGVAPLVDALARIR